MFKNMKLGTKMAAGFAVPLAMIAVITVITFISTNKVQTEAKLAKEESAVFTGYAREMKLDVVQVQQFISDYSATQAKDGYDDGLKLAAEAAGRFYKNLDKFETMFREEKEKDGLIAVAEIRTAFEDYHKTGVGMAQAYAQGGPKEGNKYMDGFDAAATDVNKRVDKFVESQTTELNGAMASIESSAGTLRTTAWIAGAIALVSGVLLAWTITRSITKPINQIIGSLTDGSEQVASASGQVSSSSQSLAQGACEQAASLEETSSSLEEMSSMTKRNSDSAAQADSLATEARGAAEKGNEAMERMSTAIHEIQKSSDETAKIIKVIDEIAFQTNLLALNAAVEAARAGEAGKGFAVVAEEVRNLAMRSAEAAKNTSSMIEESVKNSQNGVSLATEVANLLGDITGNSRKVSDLIGEISAAASEQAQGIDQVNTAVSQMDKVTQQNAASAEESASASEQLSSQAEQMNAVVNDLRNLVGGASGHASNGMLPARRRTRGAGGAPASAAAVHASEADHLIPFDEQEDSADNDFSAFDG